MNVIYPIAQIISNNKKKQNNDKKINDNKKQNNNKKQNLYMLYLDKYNNEFMNNYEELLFE